MVLIKHKKIKIIILGLMILGLAYSMLSANLNINGSAEISKATWDVHFENLQLDSEDNVTGTQTITNDTTVTYDVTLSKPGDKYAFTVDVVNDGNIDAMVSAIINTTLTDEQLKYLDYSVTYSDGVDINAKDLLVKTTGKENLLVSIEFKKDIEVSDLPTSEVNLTLTTNITYVQADDSANEVKHSGMYLDDTDGDGIADKGELITIGTERFYVISNDGTNIKALAEYNLEVGSNCIYSSSYTCTAISNPSGLQSSRALGYTRTGYNTTGNYGTVAFSNSAYWTGTNGEKIDLTNSANTIYPYLTAYKTSLTNLGGKISDISLMTKEEAISLGCTTAGYNCPYATSWVYQTSYWLLSSCGSYEVWYIRSDGGIYGFYFTSFFTDDDFFGIRPVITVLASDIK